MIYTTYILLTYLCADQTSIFTLQSTYRKFVTSRTTTYNISSVTHLYSGNAWGLLLTKIGIIRKYNTWLTDPSHRSQRDHHEKAYHVTQDERVQQNPKFPPQTKLLWPISLDAITKPISPLEYKHVRHPWDSISCQSASPQLSTSWGVTLDKVPSWFFKCCYNSNNT